ncbi:MAG: SAM-dependent methyltransferase [Opitutae bacterium]|nr:SAM-dependent methyltransferase [Opitutae bacterium]
MSTGLAPEVSEFLALLDASVRDGTFTRLTLGKPRGGDDATLQNVFVRPVRLKSGAHLSFLWRHDRRDLTKNIPPADGIIEVGRLVGTIFHSAHLFIGARTAQLEFNKKGEPRLTFGKNTPPAAAKLVREDAHDRTKARLLPVSSHDWLHALGVTNSTGIVREGMADKHRQIHKFVELLHHLVADATLPHDRPIEIADMGCGKGYLTFATHDYFDRVAKRSVRVCGVELRPELVEQCNTLAHDTDREKLSFVRGTIQEATLPAPDVLIALHACDTATDDAIARGLAAGSALIVTAPCCQKELRPQLRAAPVLAPALRHGIFQERHAEFATDALRALLLEWAGYDTKVFEFISTEHTAKNLMIAATKRTRADSADERAERAQAVRALAEFYGVKRQALAAHLDFALSLP